MRFTNAGADINYIFTGQRYGHSTKQVPGEYDRGDIDSLVEAYARTDDVGRAALMAVAALIKKSEKISQ